MATAAKEGFLQKTGKFFREVRSEMKKVTWPTKSDISTYTIVVLVSVVIVTGVLWLTDTVFYKLISLILR
jgi:preprotein translocase subunit SecE